MRISVALSTLSKLDHHKLHAATAGRPESRGKLVSWIGFDHANESTRHLALQEVGNARSDDASPDDRHVVFFSPHPVPWKSFQVENSKFFLTMYPMLDPIWKPFTRSSTLKM